MQPINIVEMENQTNTLRPIDRCKLPRPSRDNKSFSDKNISRKNYNKEIERMREKYEVESKKCDDKNDFSEDACRCNNCSIVSTLNECRICLESLQTRCIRTCTVCANIVCSKCTERLKNCPFCRSYQTMQKNRAIERFLDGLFLPCRNARSGCRKMLTSEMRWMHEANCDHSTLSCPVSSLCRWNDYPASIISHLEKVHRLKPLEDHDLTVEVLRFLKKTMAREAEYTIYLLCYGQLFAVKVMLRRKKLILSFSRISRVIRVTEKNITEKYGVWTDVKVAGKRIRGVLPLGIFDNETRKLEINRETSHHRQGDHSDHDDSVKIEISIREIKNQR